MFSQIMVAPMAGLNLTNMSISGYSIDLIDMGPESITNHMSPAFHVGAVMEIAIIKGLSVEPGLLFSQKGTKIVFTYSLYPNLSSTATQRLNFIEIPANMKYSFSHRKFKIFVYTGPNIGIGINGNIYGYTGDKNITFGGGNATFKRMDLGLNFGAGTEIKNIFLKIGYQFGLSNIAENPQFVGQSGKEKNKLFMISVGYYFDISKKPK